MSKFYDTWLKYYFLSNRIGIVRCSIAQKDYAAKLNLDNARVVLVVLSKIALTLEFWSIIDLHENCQGSFVPVNTSTDYSTAKM